MSFAYQPLLYVLGGFRKGHASLSGQSVLSVIGTNLGSLSSDSSGYYYKGCWYLDNQPDDGQDLPGFWNEAYYCTTEATIQSANPWYPKQKYVNVTNDFNYTSGAMFGQPMNYSSSWMIHFKFRLDTSQTDHTIMTVGGGNGGDAVQITYATGSNTLNVFISTDGSNGDIANFPVESISLNNMQWYDFEIGFTGNHYYVFLDGNIIYDVASTDYIYTGLDPFGLYPVLGGTFGLIGVQTATGDFADFYMSLLEPPHDSAFTPNSVPYYIYLLNKTKHATVSLSGNGLLNTSARKFVKSSGSLSVSGSISVAGKILKRSSASLIGAGTISVSGTKLIKGIASLSASGILSATSHSGTAHHAIVSLSGSGNLNINGHLILHGVSLFYGNGLITVSGTNFKKASAALSVFGNLSVAGHRILKAVSALNAQGSLSVTPHLIQHGVCYLSGSGLISVSGHRILHASSSMLMNSTLSMGGHLILHAVCGLSGLGNLSSSAHLIIRGQSQLAASGILTVTASRLVKGSSALSGVGVLVVSARRFVGSSVGLSANSSINVVSRLILHSSATLSMSGTMNVRGTLYLHGVASLTAAGFIIGTARPTDTSIRKSMQYVVYSRYQYVRRV